MAHPKGERYKATWGGVDIPGLLNVDRSQNTDTVETTDFDSGNDKEFVPGDNDYTVSFEFQFDVGNTAQQNALTDWEGQVTDALTVEPKTPQTGDRTWSAQAFATSVSDTYAKAEIVAFTVDFQVTGSPTVTYTA